MLTVLTFHRVVDPIRSPNTNPSLQSATTSDFEQQVRHLAERYRVLPLCEVVDAVGQRRSLPPRSVLITFDDAYRDFKDLAWPVLKSYGVPATVFVATDYPDRPERSFWWDRIHGALTGCDRHSLDLSDDPSPKVTTSFPTPIPLDTEAQVDLARRRLQTFVKELPHDQAMEFVDRLTTELCYEAPPGLSPVLGWSELRALARDGADVAPHTRSHPVLTRVPLSVARAEIQGSIAAVKRELGFTPAVFSYPSGAHNDAVVSVVRDSGIRVAVTCIHGQNNLRRADPLRLMRTNITRRTSPFLFQMRLLKTVSTLDRWRRGVRDIRRQM